MTSLIDIGGQQIDPAAQLLDLDRADCEDSLYVFIEHAWRWMDASQFTPGWHIEAIAEHLQAVVDGQITRLMIHMPPRHGKSLIASVAFPAWVWAQAQASHTSGPGVQFLYASYADRLSLRDSVKCRRLMESPFYQRLWGNRFQLVGDNNTKSRFSNDKGGERLITSIGAGVTGEGGNCFVSGTRVNTPKGYVAIEELRPNDEVYSANESGEIVIGKVTATIARVPKALMTVTFSNQKKITCTPEHLVATVEDRFQQAINLRLGQCVEGFSHLGYTIDEEVFEVSPPDNPLENVFDIQVSPNSNFFAEGILVHNCIIIDDPNAAIDIESEATTQATIDWWSQALSTRTNDPDKSAIILIQQRLDMKDLSGYIMEKEFYGWTHLCLPGRFEKDRAFVTTIGWQDPRTEEGELLWPARFSDAALKRLEVTMGPYVFAGQIQQRPSPKGGGIIKDEWWKPWPVGEALPLFDHVFATLDTAYTTDQMNDPSGICVWGIFSGSQVAQASRLIGVDGHLLWNDRAYVESAPKLMLIDSWKARLELFELVTKVAATAKGYKIDLLIIENKASGISVAQELKRLYSRGNFGVQLFDPKNQDKTARLYSVQHLFAEGLVYCYESEASRLVRDEVSQFPKAPHDEFVDCTSMALRYARDSGVLTRAPERRAELDDMKQYPERSLPLYPC